MSMHLEGPWLSTTGKSKSKQKFRSAEEAKRFRDLEKSWQELQKKYSPKINLKKSAPNVMNKSRIPPGRETRYIPSIDNGHIGAVSSKPPQMYTGSNVLGVTIVHKSCLQPVFSKQEAVDASKMRR